MNAHLKRYGEGIWRVISHPAWLGAVAVCSVGLVATSATRVRARWPTARLVFVGGLGLGVMYGLLAPLFPTIGEGVQTAATVAATSASTSPQPRSRSAINKTFEPAQGTESRGPFIGQ